MADRLISSYIIPTGIIFGAALQKNFQIFHIALQNYGKGSTFFYAAIICGSLNVVTLLCYIALLDYTVSPYNWSLQNFPLFLASIATGFTNIILYLKKSLIFRVFFTCNVVGLLVQVAALIVNVLNAGVVLSGQYVSVYVTPYATMQALLVMVNNFLQTINFIAASYMFIFNIASKLGVSRKELASQLIMKYALCDYIILAGLKLYSCIALIIVLKNNKIPTNVTLVATVGTVNASPIYAAFVFVHASFNASKQLLSDFNVSKQYSTLT
ncbi:hypothetical protein HDV01_007251 [Terramyces sp. JEL0728]|nr:hypothetical protein HDV01_007251 [Terramyces sp. JEL0728]